jgi:hypothetical protein
MFAMTEINILHQFNEEYISCDEEYILLVKEEMK